MTREAVAGRMTSRWRTAPGGPKERAGQRTWDVVVGVTMRVVDTSTQV